MAKIKIRFDDDTEIEDVPDEKPQVSITLDIRKSLNGDYMIKDHPLIDIIVMPQKNKILALSKDSMGDRTYYAQNKLFDFLYKKGVIAPDSIQAGNIYSSMEATILTPIDQSMDPIQVAVFSINKFLEKEMPIFAYEKQFDEMQEDNLTEPDDSKSTELGEVPHKPKKGVLGQSIHTPQNAYNYSYFGEGKDR